MISTDMHGAKPSAKLFPKRSRCVKPRQAGERPGVKLRECFPLLESLCEADLTVLDFLRDLVPFSRASQSLLIEQASIHTPTVRISRN